jgi:hypothetical protein
MFDNGAEGLFPASLYSLRTYCSAFYEHTIKIVIDCGISSPFRDWLNYTGANIYVIVPPSQDIESVIGGSESKPAQVMRRRIELAEMLRDAIKKRKLPAFEVFLHCDPDTLFLRDPSGAFDSDWEGEDVRCVTEWDWSGPVSNNEQRNMSFFRGSSFRGEINTIDRTAVAAALGCEESELTCVPTVNSGVWLGRVDGTLSAKWRREYTFLTEVDRSLGGNLLSPYSTEQNALSWGIYRGTIIPRFISRNYNYLPPREPYTWPETVCIAHFVTFALNWPRRCFRLWSQVRAEAVNSGFVPLAFSLPQFVDP